MTTLVLLPGLDGTALLFKPLLEALDPSIEVKCIAYPTEQGLSYAQLVEWVKEKLPEGPFVLLGESFSGPIAVKIAATETERTAGVILCATFARSSRPLLNRLGGLLPILPFGAVPMAAIHYFLLGRFSTPALRQLLAAALAVVPQHILKQRLGEVLRVDVSAMLQRLTCPLLYLQASEDRLVPASAAEWISRQAPAIAVERLEAPHFLLQFQPERSACLIQTFVQKTAALNDA